eukprot:TRINITY_DN4513_c0_g1_i1.p1 TRINITY_DN4513_c0_g1~~TRINITY_DN4513_c0_g1_i1.p1  ORF type:complete len:182 (-),score=39.21 TRINITY_DN4513_c0_g1_i1:80-625(-)
MAATRALFGGAIVADVPPSFEDVSEVRGMPDNIEAFSDATTDQSVVIELAELDDAVADADAPAHYMDDVASTNDATDVATVAAPAPVAMPGLGVNGTAMVSSQSVSKFREAARNTVHVYLCVVRLRQYTTDIVITLNSPVAIAPHSSSAAVATSPPADPVAIFGRLLQTFTIRDPSLFITH